MRGGIPPFVKVLPPLAVLAGKAMRHRHEFGGMAGGGHSHGRRHGPRGPWGRDSGWGPGGPWAAWGRGFEFRGFPGPFGGRGPRARRGDIRAGILHLLAERPMHGYEMIRELADRSGGVWRPSAGSIYPTLQLLEDEGLVTSEQSAGKKLYTLTDAGRAEVEQAERAPWEEFEDVPSDSPWHDVRKAGMNLAGAVFQAGQAASEAQMRRVVDVLNETRTKIYRILSDDEPEAPRDGDGGQSQSQGNG
jgi:DNA-binding PadR family transcriptional regulator